MNETWKSFSGFKYRHLVTHEGSYYRAVCGQVIQRIPLETNRKVKCQECMRFILQRLADLGQELVAQGAPE